jgi:RNA polymerase sigma-70 factor (ECF subfamily)
MLEDELLKRRFKRGSPEALSRIYEKYFDSLLTLAMGLLRHAEDAQDVVHDVFVSFARSANEFHLQGSLSGYLATSVVNRVRDRRRMDRRHGHGPDVEPALSSPEAGPAQRVIYHEQTQRLNEALAALPYDQREVIVLRLKAGMRFREIAKLQGAALTTVQSRYHYGLDRLRSLLAEDEVNP